MKAMPVDNPFADFATLAWLDFRIASNTFGRIHREPLRLIGWMFWIGFFVWKLVVQPRGSAAALQGDTATLIDIAASMLLFVASISLIRGEQPTIAFFASPLEARWMIGSHLRPWVTVPYLQLRNVFKRLPSFAIFLAFVLSYCLPPTHALFPLFVGIVNVVLLTLCSRLVSLPRELAPDYIRIPLILIGMVVCAAAILAGLEALAHLMHLNHLIPAFFPAIHPGLAFILGARGNLHVLLFSGGLTTVCLSSLVLFSRDRYPELYEISRAGWEVRSRFREGRMRVGSDERVRELTARELAGIPSGALVLLWTNWQMYRRQNLRGWIIIRPLLALGLGLAVAALHIEPTTLAGTLGVVFALTTTFSSLIDATRIGVAIRHPIFWLTSTSFSARLGMILLGWYWRSAFDLAVFTLGAIFAGAPLETSLLCMVAAIVGIWLQRCIGLAAFAILPSATDLAGPTAFARFILALFLIVPPIVSGIVIATLLHEKTLGYGIGIVVAVLEAQALIYGSGRLLDGRFDKILGG